MPVFSPVSSVVRDVTQGKLDDFTLVVTWQPPASPRGEIIFYTVRIVLYSSGHVIAEENTIDSSYTESNLGRLFKI